jgi:hypothetical protein
VREHDLNAKLLRLEREEESMTDQPLALGIGSGWARLGVVQSPSSAWSG